jgi:flagellar motor switch/type III secretory pathway protein FliN
MVSDMNEGGVFEDSCLPVRIELGEIELSVAEIANLRKGGVLEVDAPGQLRCFMRVGNSIVAEGIVRIKSEGFSICIEKIVMPR